MRKFYFIACLLLYGTLSNAQLHDNNWIFGVSDHPYNVPNGVVMHFEQGYPTFSVENIRQYYSLYCAICSDSTGNLLFHTNGRAIRNRLHQIMENGDTINPGNDWVNYPYGYPSITGGFALPAPGFNNLYYLIHTTGNNGPVVAPYFPVVYTSTIDMNANNGLGKVISKNDTLATGDLPAPVAIKHGNGRDWWLIIGDYQAKKYQTFLLDPSGIHFMFDQVITPDAFTSTSGYHLASPDGRFFVNNDDQYGLWIYDFDRCSGLLSSPRVLPYQSPYFYTAVNAFSEDTRFLYVSTHLVVYQLDMLTVDEPEIALDTIARYEYGASPAPPFYTWFFTPQLASNGKIYYNTFSETNTFHVLNRPGFPLLASNHSQRGLITPRKHDETRCYFPNYSLGRSLDSPCDTLPFSEAVEDQFRHIPWEGERPTVRDKSAVRVLRLPGSFHLPEHTKKGPYNNPLSPIRMREKAIIDQQKKLKNYVPE